MPEVSEQVEVAGRDLFVLVLGRRQPERVDGRGGELPLVAGGHVGEQDPGRRAGDADDEEEVLVDGDQADRAAVTGEPAQRVREGLDVAQDVVDELLEPPDPLLAVGREGEVDPVAGQVDRQVVWPIGGGAFGVGHQSRVADHLR